MRKRGSSKPPAALAETPPGKATHPRSRAGAEVRTRLLDRAEALFAERGFHGASVRDITMQADLRLASVNYHFGSKEQLFRDVILRRAEPLNEDRLTRLGELAAEARGRSKTARVRAVVSAFVLPVGARALEDGYRAYFSLIAQTASSQLPLLRPLAEHFDPLALRFVGAFGEVFRAASQRALHQSYQLMLASTLYAFSRNLRLESVTRGELRGSDVRAVEREVQEFVTGGVVRLCRREAKRPRASRG